ncbi:Crp/Fnr family transcriptional regulator [Gracilinema caldarium]|uniref:Transcriptional regulator, Crp/Fnr family n=1 Tax=Gracilinema caldarium (strain ATCC 51460 / DSM 7334 / H1) TaxID=744872 RepID=F8F3X9_GRAC1|nr:cyclic nucleotide-binding domain-containing protein [Gracilinema caldarium]AEJ20498.1 putative transcriptional regulator, Crp/Fnr family [Gracilinema caldarium DSM 7334]
MITVHDLQKYSLFGGLMADQIERLIPLLTIESYSEGVPIITEGNRNDRIRFIIDGRVHVIRNGKQLNELGEGETFGEMEILDVMPAVATIKTVVPTRVAAISNRALRDIYKMDVSTFSMIIMNLARDLSRRLRRMDELACQEKI